MKDFAFVFRNDLSKGPSLTPEERQALDKKWMDWIGSIAAQNKLKDVGLRLQREGKVVKAGNMVTDGPYTEIKEAIGGFTVVKASNLDEAVKLSEGCPIFHMGGNVEVREIHPM